MPRYAARLSDWLLGEEAEASPSIGNTLWRVWTTFTRSAITLLKEWTDLDEIWDTPSILFVAFPDRFWARSAQKRERERGPLFVFFCLVNKARLYRFPVGQISLNLHTRRGSATRWILSERKFQNLPARGRFFQKPTSSRTTSDFIGR